MKLFPVLLLLVLLLFTPAFWHGCLRQGTAAKLPRRRETSALALPAIYMFVPKERWVAQTPRDNNRQLQEVGMGTVTRKMLLKWSASCPKVAQPVSPYMPW